MFVFLSTQKLFLSLGEKQSAHAHQHLVHSARVSKNMKVQPYYHSGKGLHLLCFKAEQGMVWAASL